MTGIFPGSITITDTGKRATSDTSVNETHLIDDGVGVTLPDIDISFSMSANLAQDPVPNKFVTNGQTKAFSWDKLDIVSLAFPKWTIQGVLDMTDNDHLLLFRKLCDLVRTKGYKTISGNWMTDNYTDYGSNAYQIFTTLPTVRVRVSAFTGKNSAQNPNIVNYSLELIQDYEE
jgi:hypothetical protein